MMMTDRLKQNINDFLNDEEGLIVAGAFTSQGDLIYSVKEVEISSRINEGAFDTLIEIDEFTAANEGFKYILSESDKELTLIRRVKIKHKTDTKYDIYFLLLCAPADTTYGALLLQMNKFEKKLINQSR